MKPSFYSVLEFISLLMISKFGRGYIEIVGNWDKYSYNYSYNIIAEPSKTLSII